MKPSRSVLIALTFAALVAACQGSSPSPSAATPSPSRSAAPTATPTALATATALPSPSPSLASAPPTTGAAGAFAAVLTYENALVERNFEKAWHLLGSGTKARYGTITTYTSNRTAFLARAGDQYQAQISPNTLTIDEWIVGQSWASKINVARAYIVSVHWPGYGSTYVEIWIVNPIFTGWELYLAN